MSPPENKRNLAPPKNSIQKRTYLITGKEQQLTAEVFANLTISVENVPPFIKY
jgi:hypothetical protein